MGTAVEKDHSEGYRAELANAITHGLGAALSILALVLLVVLAALHGSARHVVGGAIFGATLVVLYTMSTLYHALTHPGAKRVFKILDHAAIYLLIAGTYTPFCLATLRGPWGWSLFGVVWGLALLGVLFKALFIGRFEFLSTAVYLAMGWLVLVAAVPLYRALPPAGLAWLLAGGLCYTGGVAFYVWHKLKFHHAVWHLFVLGGSICHVVAVLGSVIPSR
jgi:hemolysin III